MDNKELGRLVLKQVTEYPETFDMRTWGCLSACGTIACLAGHAMLLSGYGLTVRGFVRPDGTRDLSPRVEAKQLLGLAPSEVSVFDEYCNDCAIDRFRRMLDDDNPAGGEDGIHDGV